MSVGWNGPDPTGFADGGGTSYELGTKYTALADVTLNSVRVWAPGSSTARANRAGKVWSNAGGSLATAAMPDSLPSGWSVHALDVPVPVTAGTSFIVSYDTTDTYGAAVGGFAYPLASADGSLNAIERRLHATPDNFPPSGVGNTFYGIDVQYTAGIGGNAAPALSDLRAEPAGNAVLASWSVTDESPGTVSFVVEWGDGTQTVTSATSASHTYATTGSYAVLVTATDVGGLKDSIAAPVRIVGVSTAELALNRLNTKAFIDARPSTLALIPVINTTTETGGRRTVDAPPRVAQVMRLIEQVSAYGNSPGLLPSQDGQERRVTYQLLGEWDCLIEVGDHWLDAAGIRYEVRELLPFNGYERRGRVVQYG